jgi:isopentenyl phosphate kinase
LTVLSDSPCVFLKLGGALITEKAHRETVRRDVLDRLAREIASWPGTAQGRLIVAHGSGSFAHAAVTATGFLDDPADPLRLARVAAAARRLDDVVIDAMLAAGLPAIAVPGSLLARCDRGNVVGVRGEIVTALREASCLPVVYGDAAPDRTQGGAIASTEPLLVHLARDMRPQRIVLATDVDGVYESDPRAPEHVTTAEPIALITPASASAILSELGTHQPGATDVSGGMAAKVAWMVALVAAQPQVEVRILSGLRPGAVASALAGDPAAGGTMIRAG